MPARHALTVALLSLTLAACGGDSNDPDGGPSDLEEQAQALFPDGGAQDQALELAGQLDAAADAGDMAGAEEAAFELTQLTLSEYYAGRLSPSLSTAPAPLDAFLTDAFTLAGLGDPGLENASFADDGLVAVVSSSGGLFVTPSLRAGLEVPSGAAPRTTLLAITRLADSSAYLPTDGPLPTDLDQYPYFYEFHFTPDVTLTADGIIGLCQFADIASAYYPADAVFARLRLAHPDPADQGRIETLELVDAPFLNCDGAGASMRGAVAAQRRGGIGGRVRKFSPFAAVDPQVTTPGGTVDQLGQDFEGATAGETFGQAVALSANGNRLIVGSPLYDGAGTNIGRAHVYDFNGTSWVQVGTELVGAATEDRYAGAVAISNDGSRIAVGSYLNDGNGTSSGMVRVFDLVGGTWTQVGADIYGNAGRGQGWSLDLNGTGNRIIIGGPAPNSVNGEARVYEYSGGAWAQVGNTFALSREFGHAVAIADNGNRIAMSYPSASGQQLPGSVETYDWNGSAWTQAGAVLEGEGGGDGFGGSLFFSADGNRLAVGAEGNDGGGSGSGQVRVFQWGGSAWTQLGSDIDGLVGENLGASVSLSADGTRVISGGLGCGARCVRLYHLVGGAWVQQTLTLGTASRLGDVSISADGSTFAFGSIYFRGAAGTASGLVRVFRPSVANQARQDR